MNLIAEPLAINPTFLYPLDSAKRILSWGNAAMRSARR